MLGALVLWITYKSFPLTALVYILILTYSVILMIGGHYTFAEVPGFDGLTDLFGEGRNNYDKLSHFAQGVVPALIIRELILRKDIIQGTGWRQFFIVSVCLACSAFYELTEWWGALLSGQKSELFLGTQGYEWDTQSDMGMALLGAITGLICLSRLHDKQLRLQDHRERMHEEGENERT